MCDKMTFYIVTVIILYTDSFILFTDFYLFFHLFHTFNRKSTWRQPCTDHNHCVNQSRWQQLDLHTSHARLGAAGDYMGWSVSPQLMSTNVSRLTGGTVRIQCTLVETFWNILKFQIRQKVDIYSAALSNKYRLCVSLFYIRNSYTYITIIMSFIGKDMYL